MNKLGKFLNSFYKNVIVKRKFRAFWAVMFDGEFRENLNKLHRLTKHCTRSEVRVLDYECIQPGHRLIYPKYAEELLKNWRDLDVPLIRVVADPECQGRYIVVDGNHRLPALKERARRTYRVIKCEVMV